MKKKVLVTGAFGQLGNAVLKKFQDTDMLATDLFIPEFSSGSYSSEILDVTKPEGVQNIVNRFQPDVVLNLAAMTDVDGCEINPEVAEKINSESVLNFLDVFDGVFIHISTDYVFNGKTGPYDEEDVPDPINMYGKTKLSSEKYVMKYPNPWCIVRTNVVFDYAKNSDASFVKWVIDSLQNERQIQVVHDQWNNPTWTDALADALRIIVDKEATGLFHYGGAEQINRLEFAQTISKVFNLDDSLIKPITTESLEQIAPRPLKCGLKTHLIKSKLQVTTLPLEVSLKHIKSKLSS